MDELALHQLKDLLIDPEVEKNFKRRKILNFLNEIYKSKNKNENLVLIKNFCEDLLENNYIQAVQLILNSLNTTLIEGHRISFKRLEYKVLKVKGDLQKQNKLLIEILEYCILRKCYTKGQELLESEGYILFPEQYYLLKLIFSSQSGDYAQIEKSTDFDFIMERYLSESTLGFEKLDVILESHLISQKIDLLSIKVPRILFALKIKFVLNKIALKKRLDSKPLDEIDIVINALYRRIVSHPSDIINYILLASLGNILERKQILLGIKAVILTNPEVCSENPYYENLLNLSLNKIALMKDSAIDLKKLDERLFELVSKKNLSKKDIPNELKSYQFHFSPKERDEKNLLHLVKSCEFLKKEDIKAYFKDLIVCFIFLEGHEVALKFIDKYLSEYDDSESKLIELDYLKVEILILAARLDEAEKLCEKCTEQYPLTENEQIIFLYLLGNIKFKKGLKIEAIEIFNHIKQKRPNYRSVKWRIKEIESSK
ncbi:MAG: hypothetical protein OEY33_04770 [Bdellovibrionales bacterium]|jgi:hypothetical protein|nr:hypothetical protein [Bdellovibrionales bacterium]